MNETDPETLATERARRIYYQNIVYAVCNILDHRGGRSAARGEGIVCGTVTTPSTEVQTAVENLAERATIVDRLVADWETMTIHDLREIAALAARES